MAELKIQVTLVGLEEAEAKINALRAKAHVPVDDAGARVTAQRIADISRARLSTSDPELHAIFSEFVSLARTLGAT